MSKCIELVGTDGEITTLTRIGDRLILELGGEKAEISALTDREVLEHLLILIDARASELKDRAH